MIRVALALTLAGALGAAPACYAAQGVTVRDAATNVPMGVDGSGNGKMNCVIGCTAATAANHAQCSALCTGLVVKSAAGNIYSFEVNADATLSAAAWFVLIFDATAVPANGAITPEKCYGQAAGSAQMGGTFASNGIANTTGIVVAVSTTGCFTMTQSVHAFIAADGL